MTRRRVVVRGHVQGVFFRDGVRRAAERQGVAGWVRNNRAGTVEAVLEGDEEAVSRVTEFMRAGPRGARVDGVEVQEEGQEGIAGFEVR